jgi:hypothetical protein
VNSTRTDPRRVRWATIAGLAVLAAVAALLFGHLMDSTVTDGPAAVSPVAIDPVNVVPDEPTGPTDGAVALLVAGCAALCLTLGIGCLLAVLALLRVAVIRLLPAPAPPRQLLAAQRTMHPQGPALTQLGICRI